MEVSLEAATLRALYAHSIKDLNLDQVPSSSIRRCLELVKTCYNDLEELIALRNGSPDILSSDPTYACRIDTVIADAQRGLVEVCELVPRLSSGTDRRKALKNRLEWMLVDSKEFASRGL
ncbi:hypothetical protein GE09DRAFT_1051099 [Coniochaeta sp. 2T2.1]|nr:hypothetical protein GE09DRAFT_1051099 [Coniochaeta sp. 2T2.1]